MSKRGNAEGSIYRRKDGRWTAAYMDKYGKRKALYGKTRAEVAKKLTQALKAREDGLPAPSARMSLEKYLKLWLDACKPTVRHSTWTRYEQLSNTHVIPFLGKVSLTRLEPHHLQKLYANRLEKGKLSASTVNHIHRVMHKAISQAERWGYVVRNVVSLVSPPRPKKHDMNVLTIEESKSFLKAAKGDRFEALFILALTTGMRQGELLALRWRDIDLDAKRLEVRHTLTWKDKEAQLSEPKTPNSRRRIELTAKAIDALKAHKAKQAEERLKLGDDWQDHSLVFCTEIGTHVNPSNLRNRDFFPILKKAKLGKARFHDLRHTAATILLRQNIHPKVVSEMLGHASVTITLDTYSHVLPDMQQEARKAMEGLFGS